MKIAICGSMQFAKEMLEIRHILEVAGHNVVVPANIEQYATSEVRHEDKWEKAEGDVIRNYFEKIKVMDAVLIANYTKKGVEGYVGGNGLIEMAFGHVLGKKIFILNPVPDMAYRDEIEAMKPIVINGDLSLI